MPDPLTREDYDYILSALVYARYAHEQTHYVTEVLKHQQMAYLEHIEEKLRALRDAEEPSAHHHFFKAELF
ncbi:hypothetical protein P4E94_08855 [Pontiellaceae bacterium B12219]|nr:hypothetical protein [Pontiellaceae bacterium B12219]